MRSNPADDALIDLPALREHDIQRRLEVDGATIRAAKEPSRAPVESPRLITRTLPSLLVHLQNSRKPRR